MNRSKRIFLSAVAGLVMFSLACRLVSQAGGSTRYDSEKQTRQSSSGLPISPLGGIPTRTLAAPVGGPGIRSDSFASLYTPAAGIVQPLALRDEPGQLSPTPTLTPDLGDTPTPTGPVPSPTLFPTFAPPTSAPLATVTPPPAAAPASGATATPHPTATTAGTVTATPTVTPTGPTPTPTPTATTGSAYPGANPTDIPATPYP
jgi:hypothetical protein